MASKNLIIRGGAKLKGTIGSGTGDNVLTLNTSSKTITKIPPIDLSAYLSNTLQDGYLLIGNASNVATPRQVIGDITFSNLGVANIAPNVITNTQINSAAAIAYSKLNLTNSILNVDINSSAAILRSKLASGSNYRIVTNDGSGVMIDAAAITGNRLLVSDTNGIPTFSVTTATEASYISGLSSSAQTQLNNRLLFSSALVPANGDLVYYDAGAWTRLPRGTSGQYLTATAGSLQWVTTPNGVPTGGTTGQYLNKINGTDFNTQWSSLTLSKITDVTATVGQVNVLTTGFYDATTSVQGQLNSKLDKSLNQNYLFVGNASNIAVGLASGANGYILTSVSGVPTWIAPSGGGTVTSVAASGGTTGLSFTGSPITTTGTITLTGTLGTVNGGTNITSYTTGDILYASASNVLSKLAVGSNGQVLTLAAGIPSWAVVGGTISGLTTNRIPYATSSTTLGDDSGLTWNPTNDALTIGTTLRLHKTGTFNTFIGDSAGNFTLTGTFLTALGHQSLLANTSGTGNTGVGATALSSTTTGSSNTAVGSGALFTNIIGGNNTAIGVSALQATTGSNNTTIGYAAGDNITSGSNNLVLGANIDTQSATTSDQLSIQNIIFGTGNSGTGTTVSTGFIGIGAAAPAVRLHVLQAVSEQFRVGYDVSNYSSTGVDSSGRVNYTATGATALFQFNNLLISNAKFYAGGSATATAKIHIAAGTATANTAPLKFTSGTNLTSPEDGVVEYNGTDYFITAGATRYTVPKTLTNSAVLDFPSTAGGTNSDLTITVTGAASGDVVMLGVPNGSIATNSCFTAWVSAANTVTVRFNNYDTITAKDPVSGTFKVSVIK